MTFFIHTQLYGIGTSKRLLCTLLFAPALLLFCSYYAVNSWIDGRLVLALFAALTAMLSSEILHWLTIDEIKDGLFDIVLISPIPRFQILLNKIIVPTICGITLAVISLWINNFLSSYYRFVNWDFSFATCSFLLFAAVFSALLEFISLLIIRGNNTNIHSVLLAVGLFPMLWIYDLISKNILLFYVVIIILTLLAVGISFILLKRRHQVSMNGSGYCFPGLFGNSKTSVFGAFLRKNLSMIRYGRFTLLQFVIAAAVPILFVAIADVRSFLSVNTITVLLLSAIPSVCNIYFVFYSSLFENRNKVNEILQIQNVTALKMIIEKAVSAGIISSLLCSVSIAAISLFYICDAFLLPLTAVNCFISAIICSFYSQKIDSFKAENIHKSVISFISIMLQCIILLFI